MYTLVAFTLLGAIACIQAGGIGGIGLAGSVDGAAVIAGPSGTVQRTGLASVGPIAGPGLISAAVAPGAIVAGGGLGVAGLGLGVNGLGINGLGVNGLGVNGLGVNGLGLGLGLAGPGLAARALGLEGSGIEGQWVPDINEKLHDDGSYKPGVYGL